ADDPPSVVERAARLGEVLSRVDGVEFRYRGHRVLVRPSNTEQKVRIYAEGPDPASVIREVAERLGLTP
ncbi:TPA: phosphoglucomutase/phosphomannomutase family protein, partial [Candidatus Micrarchaeota archaeon]|nr:phosphoglucomutase/phosphomannomutase family protein [Candidatus Micrarchaeota archaeon]